MSSFKYDNIDFWPRIRIAIMSKAFYESNSATINQKYFKRILIQIIYLPIKIIKYFLIILFDINHKAKINDKCDLLFLSDSANRRFKINNKWYDVYVDPLIDEYEKNDMSYKILERSTKFNYKYPRYRNSVILQPYIILSFIRSYAKQKKIKLSEDFINEFEKLQYYLKQDNLQKYNIAISDLIKDIAYIYELSRFFQKLVNKINPLAVFIVSWYGYIGMAFCNACNRNNIKIIDIQHGVQGKYHFAYGKWENIPSNLYNTFPSIFLTWSDADSENINQWLKNSNHPKMAYKLGNLFLLKYINNNISILYEYKMENIINKAEGKKIILLTLQSKLTFPDIVLSLINDTKDTLYWLIRFHPQTTKSEKKSVFKKIKKLQTNNYEYDLSTSLPLYLILKHVDLHITKCSSVVIEASKFGIKSILISRLGRDYYNNYIKNGESFYCEDYHSILKKIDELCLNKDKSIKPNLVNKNILHQIIK